MDGINDLFGLPIPEAVEHLTYPDSPGFKGEAETGREAAEAIAPKCGPLQRLSLSAVAAAGFHGLTADELADVLEMDCRSTQPRLSELKAKGLIVDSKRRRKNARGNNSVVWVLPEFGPDSQGDGDGPQ